MTLKQLIYRARHKGKVFKGDIFFSRDLKQVTQGYGVKKALLKGTTIQLTSQPKRKLYHYNFYLCHYLILRSKERSIFQTYIFPFQTASFVPLFNSSNCAHVLRIPYVTRIHGLCLYELDQLASSDEKKSDFKLPSHPLYPICNLNLQLVLIRVRTTCI